MGNYLYDDYEAKMKVTNDIINDWNFFTKLKQNFVSPFKIFTFIQIIFISNKSPPFHIKFLQIFYNNLNILEREENFGIVIELHKDLLNKLSFHEAYNNFNVKLCDIKSKIPDRSIYNYGLVKPKKIALEHFFLYVNFSVHFTTAPCPCKLTHSLISLFNNIRNRYYCFHHFSPSIQTFV